MIRGLARTARAVVGAGLCALGNGVMLLGLKLVGELPDRDQSAPPWDDESGPEFVGATSTTETSLYLVQAPDEGKTILSAPRRVASEPLEGSAEWRRKHSRRTW